MHIQLGKEDPMPWGKHKGLRIKMLPLNYLEWLSENCDWDHQVMEAVDTEIGRRKDEDDHTWDEQ